MSLNYSGRPPSPPGPDLALSTSLSPVSVQCGTPRGVKIITLDSIFTAAGLSPPTKSYTEPLNQIITKANGILDLVEREGWTKLSPHEKVQLAFLIWKEQHTLILAENGNDNVAMAKRMVDALNPVSDKYKALEPFLRLGGDEQGDETNYFNQFLLKHQEWRDENAVCIFTMTTPFGQQMLPFIRFQKIISMVCFLVSAANAIFYYMILTTGTVRQEAIAMYGLNIGRFLRNNLTNKQMYQIIFCSNGGYPKEVLESLLVHSTLTKMKGPKTFSLNFDMGYLQGGPDLVAHLVATHLKNSLGPLLVCDFRMFPRYSNTSITTFHGDWESWKDPNATVDTYHAFLITGVRKTQDGSFGGVVFQVQDSLPGRPFVNIGLDLFKSMGVRDVVGIREGVIFEGTSAENCFDNIPLSLTSGSPRGVPLEVTTTDLCDLSAHRLSSDNLGDSAVDDTATAASADSRSPDLPLGFDLPPGKDTTNFVTYT